MSSFSADETSSSNCSQDGDDGMMEVTITVISLDGLVTKNYHPKTKLQTMMMKNNHQFVAAATTSIVTSISQDLSTEKTFFTHVPSLPLGLDKSNFSPNQSSHPVIQWPSTNEEEEDACVDKHQLLSTVRIVRKFQQEKVVENHASSMHRLKPQTFPINISLSRHGKLINLGQASVIVNGEETGTSSVSIPITSTGHKSKVKSGLKGKKGIPMMRIKDDCIKFGLKSDAMLRVLVRVTNIGSGAMQTQEVVTTSLRDAITPTPEYKDCASDPSGVYDADDFDVGYYVVDDENYADYEEEEDDDTIGGRSLSLSTLFNSPMEDDFDEEEYDYDDEEEADIVIRDDVASVSTLGSSPSLALSPYAPLLPLDDDDYEVGDTILVENTDAEVQALRRELSESKYIIQNLTEVLTSALKMSQESLNYSTTTSLQVQLGCSSARAAPSLPPPPPIRRVAPKPDLNNERGPHPPPPPPRRAYQQLEASDLMYELSKIADSPHEDFVDDGPESKLGDESDHSLGVLISDEEDVVIPQRVTSASACSLETVPEEDEEHAHDEAQMTGKNSSVVKDEERRMDDVEFIIDKPFEAEELKWKNVLDKVSPLVGTSSSSYIQDKVKHHIRKGLPDSMRQRAWVVLTGVDRIMNERKGVYQGMLRHANSISQASGLTPNDKYSNRTVLNQIDKDTDRTSLKHSSSERTFSRRELRRVLRAYSQFDPEVGYCQGMNYIVATFLSFLSEEEAFWLLVVVMNEEPYNLRELFSEDMSGTHEMLYIAEKLMKQFFPKLSKHLQREEVRASMFVTQWLMTLYTSSFPLDMVSRVWDSFLVEGWKVVYRTMLGLMKHAEGTLLHLSFEHILHYLSSFPGKVDGQTIMQESLKIGLKTKHIQKHANDWQRSAGSCSQDSPSFSPKKVSRLDSATLSTCSTSTR